MKKLVLIACVLAGFVGCSTTGTTTTTTASAAPSATPVQPEYTYKDVEIISDPVGARIEVNDEYMGDAPITIRVPVDGYGYCYNSTGNMTIRAIPSQGGDYLQTKILATYWAWPHYPVPSKIFFDMHLGPVAETTNRPALNTTSIGGRLPGISTQEAYDALPHGSEFIWLPDGQVYEKTN